MSAFQKGNIFRFNGFDHIDAILLFCLGAVLSTVGHLFPGEMDPRLGGAAIAVALVLTLYFREVLLPKKNPVVADRLKILGLISVVLCVFGFIFSIIGFNTLNYWVKFTPRELDNSVVQAQLIKKMQSEEMIELASIVGSATREEPPPGVEVIRPEEGDSPYDLLNAEAKKRVQERRVQIENELKAELQSQLDSANTHDLNRYRHWSLRLIPLALFLLLLGSQLENLVRRLRGKDVPHKS